MSASHDHVSPAMKFYSHRRSSGSFIEAKAGPDSNEYALHGNFFLPRRGRRHSVSREPGQRRATPIRVTNVPQIIKSGINVPKNFRCFNSFDTYNYGKKGRPHSDVGRQIELEWDENGALDHLLGRGEGRGHRRQRVLGEQRGRGRDDRGQHPVDQSGARRRRQFVADDGELASRGLVARGGDRALHAPPQM